MSPTLMALHSLSIVSLNLIDVTLVCWRWHCLLWDISLGCHPNCLSKASFLLLLYSCSVGNSSNFQMMMLWYLALSLSNWVESFPSEMRCVAEHLLRNIVFPWRKPTSQFQKSHYFKFKDTCFHYYSVHCALIRQEGPPGKHRTHSIGMILGGSLWVSHFESFMSS